MARRLEEFPRCAAGLVEGRLSLDQVGVIAAGPLRALTSTMRSWRRWPRSTSCAPRCGSNRDPNPSLGPNRSGQRRVRSPRPAMSGPVVGGSDCLMLRRRRSTPRWPLTSMR
ncbi:hypothetical protein I552_9948 [Mycobacterium xenopi 3993]|nr:hypothetical protein I552_9948 [Mycobacterium xenopi 3993]